MHADGKGSRTITEKGFRFLLLDTYNQLWTLLREYLVDADRRSGTPSFLPLQLGSGTKSNVCSNNSSLSASAFTGSSHSCSIL